MFWLSISIGLLAGSIIFYSLVRLVMSNSSKTEINNNLAYLKNVGDAIAICRKSLNGKEEYIAYAPYLSTATTKVNKYNSKILRKTSRK